MLTISLPSIVLSLLLTTSVFTQSLSPTRTYICLPFNQTPSSRSPVQERVEKSCQPNLELRPQSQVYITPSEMKDIYYAIYNSHLSPFPCERAQAVWYSCFDLTKPEGHSPEATQEWIEKERACICPSKYFELLEACFRYQGLHGYGSAYMERRVASMGKKKERMFYNEKVPEDN